MATSNPENQNPPQIDLNRRDRWFQVRQAARQTGTASRDALLRATTATVLEGTGELFFGDNTATAEALAAGITSGNPTNGLLAFGAMRGVDALPNLFGGRRETFARIGTSELRAAALPVTVSAAGGPTEAVVAATVISTAFEVAHQFRGRMPLPDNVATVITPPNQLRFALDALANNIGLRISDPNKARK